MLAHKTPTPAGSTGDRRGEIGKRVKKLRLAFSVTLLI